MKKVMEKLTKMEDLSPEEIKGVIVGVREERVTEAQIGGFLMGLLMKGPTAEEMAALVEAMLDLCPIVKAEGGGPLVDTCGTGGGLPTFNVSTGAAIVAAAGGVAVAKYMGRSTASGCGSADVLKALGVQTELDPRQAQWLLGSIGIAFCPTLLFHPVMARTLGPGSPLDMGITPFTVVEVLINPLGPKRHILGLSRDDMVRRTAEVLGLLGYEHALVVHGLDGYDELSLVGESHICEVRSGRLQEYIAAPGDLGMKRCRPEDLVGGSPRENAEILEGVLSGRISGPKRDMLVLNAAGAFVVGGRASDLREGAAMAEETIASGRAMETLNRLREELKRLKKETGEWGRDQPPPLSPPFSAEAEVVPEVLSQGISSFCWSS